MISVVGVSKRFGGTLAVDDVSFEVARGEILGLLGPNGAGKTTTMRMLSCFLAADTGRATVAGFDVAAEPLEVRRRLGYLPENNPLYFDMTVAEYLSLVAEVRRVPRADKARLVGRAVEGCALGPVRGRIIGQLSKGYRQRVGLAGALLHDPEVLILDEPTVGLDPTQIIEIRELIRGIGSEKTVLLSSHILPEVEATCQRVIIFNEGHLVGQGTPAELAAQARGSEFVDLAVRGPRDEIAREIAAVPGVVECVAAGEEEGVPRFRVRCEVGADPREELAAAIARRGWGLLELHAERLSLEAVFIKLTGGDNDPRASADPEKQGVLSEP
ncbi:MAG: ATP-binding cassette domain-containing protein [Candidatus Methylomirabilia bacterium]